ncbi:MAG: CPBP family glutamic-type intramembrane protease [Methylacidiphilales bacterium]|nr:CPBP family glutamic-type intramembrane protease [Candidatus Methylacidiphilales bacterium]
MRLGADAQIQARAHFLKDRSWESVTNVNRAICERGRAAAGPNPQSDTAGLTTKGEALCSKNLTVAAKQERKFSLLLLSLWFWTAIFSAHANVKEPDAGDIGSALAYAKDSDFLTVEYVAVNSPTAKAGIKKGDCVTAINDISTRGMSLKEARHSIDGNIGGMVKLTVRHGASRDEQVPIVRQSFPDTYLQAATEGDPRAEFSLGLFYQFSPTTTRDLPKAVEWYRKAADQGYDWAQTNLAYMYKHGLGAPKDLEASAAWYLKAAKQEDAVAETNLALLYYRGEGVHQSDKDAFDWFYSAALQGDSTAEYYLGLLYRDGRSVAKNDREAFIWYYRSAQQDNFSAEWCLAYMYEKGRGVTRNIEEALKWYHKAQIGFPQDKQLKKDVIRISLKAFLGTRDFTTLDLSLIMSVFQREILCALFLLVAVYIVGGIVLFYFSLRVSDAELKLPLAIGWVVFYLESQGVALFAVFIHGKLLTADTLIAAMAIFSALPVIASSCVLNRRHIWKASQTPWKTLLLYGTGSCLAALIIALGYDKIYTLITHSSLPSQATLALFLKAKQVSAWLTYASIALALPVAEEVIFRGYLFDVLRKHFSGNIVVLITALAFSLVHFQWLYFVPLFGFGLVLGWVKLKTNSLRLPVFLHAINNALVLAFAG